MAQRGIRGRGGDASLRAEHLRPKAGVPLTSFCYPPAAVSCSAPPRPLRCSSSPSSGQRSSGPGSLQTTRFADAPSLTVFLASAQTLLSLFSEVAIRVLVLSDVL